LNCFKKYGGGQLKVTGGAELVLKSAMMLGFKNEGGDIEQGLQTSLVGWPVPDSITMDPWLGC